MKKKSALLIPVLCLALLLSGCEKLFAPTSATSNDTSPTPTQQTEPSPAVLADYDFILPYYSSQGFNPYLSNNVLTQQTADLLFEKLLVIDPSFGLEYHVLKTITNTGVTVTLAVDASYRFSDGNAVSAQDVLACIEAARTSTSYAARFSNIDAIELDENGLIVITLKMPDALFAYLLDIPVMRAQDVTLSKPMASGRYTYSDTSENQLVPNPLSGADAPFSVITLNEISGSDALSNSLNIGAISIYASEGEGTTSGINSSRQASYYTNTLVFLGFNSISDRTYTSVAEDGTVINRVLDSGSSPLFATPAGRLAINNLLDRTQLLEKVYYNRGHIAAGLLNPIYQCGTDGRLSGNSDSSAAITAIEALGYQMGMDGYYHLADENWTGIEDTGNRLVLRLLVYSGSSYKRYLAQLIAEELHNAGIQVMLDECSTLEAYEQKITALDFDMYIGEIKLYNNMDLSAFFNTGGAASYGLSPSEALLSAYTMWHASTAQSAALEAQFAQELPFAPLFWRSGTLYYSKALDGFTPTVSSVFYQMETVSLAGTAAADASVTKE